MDFTEKFREAVRIPTYWPPGARDDDSAALAPLCRFQEFLASQFPVFHQKAERHALSPFMAAYRLPGESPAGNDAVLIVAHYDVVPAETEKWSVDPFGAEINDGFIYGRGALDMKNILISIMEAAENLCAEGWKPKRDIWLAFGGDEERSGILGAMKAAAWFEQRGQRFAWILDEGTPVAVNQVKGVDLPLALISIEEKGYVSFCLAVEQEPGHASRPPKVQAAAVLGKALCKIAKKSFPFRLSPAAEAFFREIAPFVPGVRGNVMRHARALGPLFFRVAANSPTTAALMRTTVAITRLEGSAADNVLPSEAKAVINLRLLWPWTVETAMQFIIKIINDKRVKVSIYGLGTDPVAACASGGSGPGCCGNGWPEIKLALEEAWPGVPPVPFLMIATTDSRHYQKLSDSILRFSPYQMDQKELGGVHGHDERISLENLRRGLVFYTALLRSL